MEQPKQITLKTQEELKICMDPTRQAILRTMSVLGEPVTPKKLADTMHITPSSAKHHLLRLASIGLVAPHHTALIHGIKATYYCCVEAEVTVGLGSADHAAERELMAENSLATVYKGFRTSLTPEKAAEQNKEHFSGDMHTGVLHLTQPQADELYHVIRRYLRENSKQGAGTLPFEYALILYRAEVDTDGKADE